MYRLQLYLDTLAEFAGLLLTPYEVEDVLAGLAERVVAILGLAGSGVSLAHGGRLEYDTGTGGVVTLLEEVQERHQAGPCVEAFRTGVEVTVDDLAEQRERWPDYCAVAATTPIGAVAAIPIRAGEQTFGALNLYAVGTREWQAPDVAVARVMANMASVYLVHAAVHEKQLALTEQLQAALDARVVIEQATGMLAARHEISPQVAFERLRIYARSHHATVRSVADAIVRLGLDV